MAMVPGGRLRPGGGFSNPGAGSPTRDQPPNDGGRPVRQNTRKPLREQNPSTPTDQGGTNAAPAPEEQFTGAGDIGTTEGKWNRIYLAGFICFTYILAFGRAGDGKNYLEGAVDSAGGGLSLPNGKKVMPKQVSVRAGAKGKLVQRGKRGTVSREGLGATRRGTGRLNARGTVRKATQRGTTQTATEKRPRNAEGRYKAEAEREENPTET